MTRGCVRYLQPGDLVFDYSSSRPSMDFLRQQGVKGVSRYIAVPNDATKFKILTLDEAQQLADAGILIMVNLETNNNDPLKGAQRGKFDAEVTEIFRTSGAVGITPALDWPLDLPVVASLDVGITTAQLLGPVVDYYAAYNEGYSGAVGNYHGVPTHQELSARGLSTLHWTAGDASSWSNPHNVTDFPTMVLQKGGMPGFDFNRVLTPTPFWDLNGTVDPPKGDVVAGHICFAQRADGRMVEIVARESDGNHRWRYVGEIPGGAGTFYAVHPGAAGVNPIGDNECNAMGHFEPQDDINMLAAMLRAGGGTGGGGGSAPTTFNIIGTATAA